MDQEQSPVGHPVTVNWIEAANSLITSYLSIVKKSLVIGLSNSNSLGGYEIRDDCTRREKEEVITELFGEEAVGFTSQ